MASTVKQRALSQCNGERWGENQKWVGVKDEQRVGEEVRPRCGVTVPAACVTGKQERMIRPCLKVFFN